MPTGQIIIGSVYHQKIKITNSNLKKMVNCNQLRTHFLLDSVNKIIDRLYHFRHDIAILKFRISIQSFILNNATIKKNDHI